jgi:hypothetical protein
MADVYRKNGGVDSKSLETERNWKKKGWRKIPVISKYRRCQTHIAELFWNTKIENADGR